MSKLKSFLKKVGIDLDKEYVQQLVDLNEHIKELVPNDTDVEEKNNVE